MYSSAGLLWRNAQVPSSLRMPKHIQSAEIPDHRRTISRKIDRWRLRCIWTRKAGLANPDIVSTHKLQHWLQTQDLCRSVPARAGLMETEHDLGCNKGRSAVC